jgi:hypothetical protein
LPSTRNSISGNEDCLGRAIVTVHVAFNVATIPGIALRVDDRANRGDGFCVG